MSSRWISLRFAPKELIFTNPLIPNVDGIHHETTFQKTGSAFVGHDIPDSNKNVAFVENLLRNDFDLEKVKYPRMSKESLTVMIQINQERR